MRRPNVKKYVIDAFSWKGGVAHAVRDLGFAARESEVEQGYHLLVKKIQNNILNLVIGTFKRDLLTMPLQNIVK